MTAAGDSEQVTVTVRMSRADAGRLILTRHEWSDPERQALIGTQINSPDDDGETGLPIDLGRHWKYAYRVAGAYANLLLARAWLEAGGHPFEIAVQDPIAHEYRVGELLPPDVGSGWMLLTDYDFPVNVF